MNYLENINRSVSKMSRRIEQATKAFENDSEEDISLGMKYYFEALQLGEKVAYELRQTHFEYGICDGTAKVKDIVVDAFPCEAGYTKEGWFFFSMPRLPSFKSNSYSVTYLRDTLYTVFEHLFSSHKLERYLFENCVLIFRNVYSGNDSKKAIRDNDNYEYKAVTNLLTTYFIPDDSPKYCDTFLCSVYGDEDATEVFIVPRREFPTFFLKMANMGNFREAITPSKPTFTTK